ncbi:unnamed protein product [Angiostrongylus costaricensis]|uniref:Phenazine biosynthesis-like domain-containing protein 1 n=1 Tax=Angiostrongylus costaricensis TaxID=334426 RepID=A0A158PJH4_ANGCS|nr:unnamed protein product [Angiostrongylus costaricensis]
MEKNFPIFIVDAFTRERFCGNQAAVCLISRVNLRDDEYQKISTEFNLSETAFPLPINGDFRTASRFTLRWFTPSTEVDLCGHATLATSHVLFHEIGNTSSLIMFTTKSGDLMVEKKEHDLLEMNFPQYTITSIHFPGTENPLADIFSEFDAPPHVADLISSFIPSTINVESVAYASEAKKLIIVVDKETTNFELAEINANDCTKMLTFDPNGDFVRGVIVTLTPANSRSQGFVDSENDAYDYVCRYFAPWVGINEDPATGSAQCALAPFWGKILKIRELYAFQSFPNRGAQFKLCLEDNCRLSIFGQSVTVVKGQIYLNEALFY